MLFSDGNIEDFFVTILINIVFLLQKRRGRGIKPGLHLNANDVCGQEVRQNIRYIRTLAFAEAANRPYINVLYMNSL